MQRIHRSTARTSHIVIQCDLPKSLLRHARGAKDFSRIALEADSSYRLRSKRDHGSDRVKRRMGWNSVIRFPAAREWQLSACKPEARGLATRLPLSAGTGPRRHRERPVSLTEVKG
jgi:hypothetical protein